MTRLYPILVFEKVTADRTYHARDFGTVFAGRDAGAQAATRWEGPDSDNRLVSEDGSDLFRLFGLGAQALVEPQCSCDVCSKS